MRLVHHDDPDTNLIAQCRYLESVRKSEGQSAYWRLVRELLKTDPWFMMRVAMEWGWLDENIVGDKFIKHLSDNWGEDKAFILPRGHGKTLPMAAVIQTAICNDPNIAILETSRTDDNAEKFGAFIATNLMHNDYLQQCFGRKYNPRDGFLPSSVAECQFWGKDGYALPWRKPRIDPTLLCISLKAAKAGKHPDFIMVDDPTERENNDEPGWRLVEDTIDGLKMLLPSDGFIIWCGTRWHDADPLGRVEKGTLKGKQGRFSVLKMSCYTDDDPAKPPIYPRKIRWNMTKPTGYTPELLEEHRKSRSEGGMGEFFDAQMRNDPSPYERADIKVTDINVYRPEDLPRLDHVRAVGIEVTGGGLPIFNGLRDRCEEFKLNLPLQEINNPRRVDQTKRDRIVAILQPITAAGKLYAQDWMIGHETCTDTLGYELRRMGAAAHDDIADALHNIIAHLTGGVTPQRPDEPAHVYIGVDLAYSEKKRSDWTVLMAVAVDHMAGHWVLDYQRFQLSSPTAIQDRIIAFYQQFESTTQVSRRQGGKFPGTWR